MRKISLLLIACILLLGATPLQAQEEGAPAPNPPPTYGSEKDDGGGWFIGSDQGVLFFVGDSSNFVGAQYYGTEYGGYNVKGWFQPILRLGQALGSLNQFGNPTTFFFILEGGMRFTPIHTKVRPYFLGTGGMYVLNFSNFGSPVRDDTNFTFSGGGGLEVALGPSRIIVGSAYRGFINDGRNLKSVEVTVGYAFQF